MEHNQELINKSMHIQAINLQQSQEYTTGKGYSLQ